jgi:transposase
MTLGYSRWAWINEFRNERLEQLLAAREHAFEHFGGGCDEALQRKRPRIHVVPF